ncbi:MAG: RNA polymerase sigma-70 factor [Bacteroidota bacterium]|nr:RNA polymerase sigma-70 factor [Bacteroidota bacterium]
MVNFDTTDQLITRISEDDSEAFEALFHLYNKRVYAFAYGLLRSSPDAEEIVQNVFMAVWNQRKALQFSSSFLAYLYGIARHMVYRFIQQRVNHEAFIEYYLEHNNEYAFITEDQVLYKDFEDLLQRFIQKLPERRREIFVLSRIENMSYKEISEKLGISENTVDTQIRHALAYLRVQLVELNNQ